MNPTRVRLDGTLRPAAEAGVTFREIFVNATNRSMDVTATVVVLG
jgi:hypothetical protein